MASKEQMMVDSGDKFLSFLAQVAQKDAEGLKKAAESYGNSWKQRGGVGAFMMLARKWDRLENRLKPDELRKVVVNGKQMSVPEAMKFAIEQLNNLKLGLNDQGIDELLTIITAAYEQFQPYDIFEAIANDPRSEGIIDDVRDLRRYLLLVECEMLARGFEAGHRDNE